MLTENEILFLICCSSCMSMFADGEDIILACDQVTRKLMEMNRENHPVPDGWKEPPENIDEIIRNCVVRYKEDIMIPLIKKLTETENDVNIKEETVE